MAGTRPGMTSITICAFLYFVSQQLLELLARVTQWLQELLGELVDLVAAGIGAHAHGRNDAAAGFAHRHGDHTQPHLDLLVIERIAGAADTADLVPDLLGRGPGLRRQLLNAGRPQDVLDGVVGLAGKEHTAGRSRQGGEVGTDAGEDAQDAARSW